MEHWGLVTFRETSVLFKEGISSSTDQVEVALSVAHELAHMWFGNLGMKMYPYKTFKKNIQFTINYL